MRNNSNSEKGERIRKEILKRLPSTPYKLSKELDRNPSTILHHLKILLKQGIVHSIKKENKGRINTIYSIIKLNENKNEIILSRSLFKVNNGSKIFGYALSGNTFGISNKEKKEWDKGTIWKEVLHHDIKGNEIKIKIPENIWRFYEIPLNSILPSYSEKKDHVFLTF
ncbi:MAG: ArsR/SmtB family transcription factor [Candidatus Helarchaeota archaeon]